MFQSRVQGMVGSMTLIFSLSSSFLFFYFILFNMYCGNVCNSMLKRTNTFQNDYIVTHRMVCNEIKEIRKHIRTHTHILTHMSYIECDGMYVCEVKCIEQTSIQHRQITTINKFQYIHRHTYIHTFAFIHLQMREEKCSHRTYYTCVRQTMCETHEK